MTAENYFSIFPNPSGTNFIITRSSVLHDAYLTIYNAIGEKVYSDRFSCGEKQKEIYIKDATPGIYLIKVTTDGVIQYCKKLLKN